MKKWIALGLLLCTYLAYGIYLHRYDVQIISKELQPSHPERFFDYRGAFHVLSQAGRGDAAPLVELESARAVGLDFVIFNDLNKAQPNPRAEGYFNGVLSIEGASFSYLDSRLLFIPSSGPKEFGSLGNAQVFLADLLSQESRSKDLGMAILAHPHKQGFHWQGAYPSGLGGIEVINLRSVWNNSWLDSRLAFLWSLFVIPFNSELALLRLYKEPEAELALWDELAQNQFVLGLAGAQSKSSRVPLGFLSFNFPSYEISFGLTSNHVLLETELIGDAQRDRALITQALHRGSVYMSMDILGDPKGFSALMRQNQKIHSIGSELSLADGPITLEVALPAEPHYPYEIVILHNGERIDSTSEIQMQKEIERPGVYRVQVRVIPTFPLPDGKQWVSWIFSNHFYVH